MILIYLATLQLATSRPKVPSESDQLSASIRWDLIWLAYFTV